MLYKQGRPKNLKKKTAKKTKIQTRISKKILRARASTTKVQARTFFARYTTYWTGLAKINDICKIFPNPAYSMNYHNQIALT